MTTYPSEVIPYPDLPDFDGIQVVHFVSDKDCHVLMDMFEEAPWTILLFQTGIDRDDILTAGGLTNAIRE